MAVGEHASGGAQVDVVAPSRMRGSSTTRLHWRIDVFDLAVLIAFLTLSMWTVIVLAPQQTPQKIWTGTNGPYLGDQMQYLGWIRDSAQHALISNPFSTSASPRYFLNPGVGISGLLVRLGVAPWLSYLMWTPIAAVGLFCVTRVYVRRLVTGTARYRLALVLALFYISPVGTLAQVFHWNQGIFVGSFSLEMWPGFYLWGYPLTAVCVALMVGTLILYDRDRRDRRIRAWTPTCTLFCSWLQPWQGATVILIIVVSEALLWRRGQRTFPALPIVTVASATLPLGYYFLLSHIDATWKLSNQVNFSQGLPTLDLLITILPLAAAGVLAYRSIPMTFQAIAVRVWPFGVFVIMRFIQVAHVGTFPKHSLQGISIPLAVLAVIGAGRLRLGLHAATRVILGTVIVAGLVGPSVARELDIARDFATPTILGSEPFFIQPSERDALDYLDRTTVSGAVLSAVYLGQIVPAETGRKTWVGIVGWTPDYYGRVAEADQLFSGKLSQSASIDLVRSTGARFLLSDCQNRADLVPQLHSILRSVLRFGCATVYILRPGG